jgi:hypothetical protein
MKIPKSKITFIFVILCLSQILFSFIYSDDLYFKYNTELLNNPFEFLINLTKSWGAQGRLTPLMFGIIIVTTKYLSILQYKFYLAILNIIALYSFAKLLKKLNPSFDFNLWVFFFFALFQFQLGYHCAFNSFNGMYPLLTIFISYSAFYIFEHIESGKITHKIYSLIFYFLALMIIEISLITPLILLFITYIKTSNIRKSLYINKENIIMTILFISISLFLKSQMHFKMNYIGIQTHFEIRSILKTYLIQTFSSLPLIYLYKQKNIFYNLITPIKTYWIYFATSLILFYTFFKINLKNTLNQYTKNNHILLLLGLILWLAPPVLISVSAKYQSELYLGRGYITLYIQNFGLATILYSLFYFIRSEYLKKGLILILFIIIFINLSYNFHLIEEATEKSYRLLKEINP